MSNSEDRGAQTYDELPYKGRPLPRTHPRNLQAVATVMGVDAHPAERCRVLELGCAEGGNLVPMAWDLPDTRFVGIDYSQRQIQEGLAVRNELGLDNLELRCLSITDMDDEPGEFDYIICHGVYSWVPEPVQEKILETCAARLTPNGVAYISYNTYPGWRIQGVVRELLRMECGEITSPGRAVERARALATFLGDAMPDVPGSATGLLREELRRLQEVRPSYLFHEYLETCNEPVHFETFATRLAAHGLSYLGEAQFSAVARNTLPPEFLAWIRERTDDPIRTEQYLDYINMRRFRQSLITRADAPRVESVGHAQLSGLYVCGRLRGPAPATDPRGVVAVTFAGETGGTLTTGAPVVKAALELLAGATSPLPFSRLLELALKIAAVPPQHATEAARSLADTLVLAYGKELVELRGGTPPYVTSVSERPRASALARHQCRASEEVASLRHETVSLSVLERALLTLADGTRTRRELLEGIMAKVNSGTLAVSGDAASDATVLATQIRDALLRLAGSALLIS